MSFYSLQKTVYINIEAWETAELSYSEVSPNTHRIDRQLNPRPYIIYTKKMYKPNERESQLLLSLCD